MVVMAAVLWGTTGTAQAFAPAGATPLAVGAVRLVLGGLGLLALALLVGQRWRNRPGAWPVVAMGAIGIAVYQLSFFAGVHRTGVAVGTVVAIGSAPILAGLLAWMVDQRRPDGRWLVATLLALAGCGLLMAAGDAAVTVDAIGVLLAIGAGGSYAVYALASKLLLADHPAEITMAVVFCGGALLVLPLLWVVDLSWLAQPAGLAVAAHLGLITVTLAYVLFGRGLQVTPLATAVTLTLAEPLTAALLGLFVLGEQLTAAMGLGIVLLLAALSILAASGAALRRRRPAAPVNESP